MHLKKYDLENIYSWVGQMINNYWLLVSTCNVNNCLSRFLILNISGMDLKSSADMEALNNFNW